MSVRYRVIDIECYRNYFLLLALDPSTGTIERWERHNDIERGLHRDDLKSLLQRNISITFNGLSYDWWMLSGYLKGYDNRKLHRLSNFLIKTEMAQWRVGDEYGLEAHPGTHIDLMPVAPLVASLKVYAGRIHAPRLQDLPIHPDKLIDEPMRDVLVEYCGNDVNATDRLHRKLKPQILLRKRLSQKYNLKIHSASDPQIAEKVIKRLLEREGVTVGRSEESHMSHITSKRPTFRYRSPECVSFVSDAMKSAHETAREVKFELSPKGSLLVPKEFRSQVKFNGRGYKMGIGGLHSTEKKQSVEIEPGEYLTDLDVTSYYPSLILTNELFPAHLGRKFLMVYQGLVDARVAAKQDGDKVTADSLKIVINSSFGKFGNRYSSLYSPQLLLQTTLSGQLYLMMLIEQIELRTDCVVVSANTDGITVFSPNKIQYQRMLNVSKQWETKTSMTLEAVQYRAVYSQDVNNYVAIKTDGTYKGKGLFAKSSLSKNPAFPIIQRAAINLFMNGDAIESTIEECDNIRGFVALRKVTGGAIYRDDEVGSTVRWYQSTQGSPILYRKNANRVPGADRAGLVNQLPDALPNDIDYDKYITASNALVDGVGASNLINHHA